MTKALLSFILGAILLTASHVTAVSQADGNPQQTAELTIPWEEFKQLLDLEEDQIVLSLDTFHKLLAQIAPTTAPPHAIREGNVVLTREAFRQLVDQMKPQIAAGATPPFDYLITKAIYSGRMETENTSFTATFHVHVLSKGVYLKVPFLPLTTALEDVVVDNKQALIVSENGYHQVVLSAEGEHTLTASFSVKSSLEQGPHKIDLAIQETPITLLRLDLPLKGIEVEIPQAQQMVVNPSGERTVVTATVARGRGISVRWRERVAVAEKAAPKLYSEVYHLVSIEDDILKVSSDINYNILHSEVDRVRLAIPEGVNVLSVEGEGVGEWQEVSGEDGRGILVPFTYGRKGAVTIRVVLEKPLSDETSTTAFSGIRVLGTVREIGFIGIQVMTSAEVTVVDSEGLEPIAVQKLPQILHGRAVKPLMHGFKYLKHPYNLVLSVRRHEKIAVPVATIVSANAVTLMTEDGKVVHRLVYQVRNSAKQFLEIQLPEGADIWAVFVDNQPAESAINSRGKLLVPLIRSRVINNTLSSFPVEVIFCLVEHRFSLVGRRGATLPPVDLLTSQLIWSVYLPNDYTYIRFSSTLEKEEMIRALNIFAGAQRQYDEEAMQEVYDTRGREGEPDFDDRMKDAYKGKDYKSQFRNVPLGEKELSSQVAAELEFGRRLDRLAQEQAPQVTVSGEPSGTGVLPIQIQVPTGGQVYRFARTIIKTEDPLTMGVSYSRNWLLGAIKWLILALVILLLYLSRGALSRASREVRRWTNSLLQFYRAHEKTAERVARSVMTPIALLGLLVPSWLVSRPLAALVFFLLWLSAGYQIVLLRRRRSTGRSVSEGGQSEDKPGNLT